MARCKENRGGVRLGAGRKPKPGTPLPDGPFNARAILQSIASDVSAAPTARVAACRALLTSGTAAGEPETEDPITMAALRLLNGGKRG